MQRSAANKERIIQSCIAQPAHMQAMQEVTNMQTEKQTNKPCSCDSQVGDARHQSPGIGESIVELVVKEGPVEGRTGRGDGGEKRRGRGREATTR